jgi:hypothetical protein
LRIRGKRSERVMKIAGRPVDHTPPMLAARADAEPGMRPQAILRHGDAPRLEHTTRLETKSDLGEMCERVVTLWV